MCALYAAGLRVEPERRGHRRRRLEGRASGQRDRHRQPPRLAHPARHGGARVRGAQRRCHRHAGDDDTGAGGYGQARTRCGSRWHTRQLARGSHCRTRGRPLPALDPWYLLPRSPVRSRFACGARTCGVNLSGLSSGGKSTAQRLAASAWSTPDIRRPGLCQSARATGNAVEALASRASGTVLVLDELAHISGEDAARMIYTIAGGSGKRRMTADATLRDSYPGRLLSSCPARPALLKR